MLSSIEEQGKLTEELKATNSCGRRRLLYVEDLYRPYRPKRRTRATIAKEKGLEPLAALTSHCSRRKLHWKRKHKNIYHEEKDVKTVDDAIDRSKGYSLQKSISDEADYRSWIRKHDNEKR